MKRQLTSYAIVFLMGLASLANAGDAVNRLKASMVAERLQLLDAAVKGWANHADETDLRKTITRLVDVHVRLQALDDTVATDFVGRVLAGVDTTQVTSVRELATALAQSYYRERGLEVNTRQCFAPLYYLLPARSDP